MLILETCSKKQTNYQKSFVFPDKIKTRTKTEEQLLLNSISQGDRHAFWQLWMLYQDYLYQRCLIWMGSNHTNAEEALSRARLKAWEKLPNYAATITNPKAWLTRMTHNLCVDIHRERQRGASSTESIESMTAADTEIVASCSNPESTMLRRELEIYINHAINALSPRLRETFILHYHYQMSYLEIAQYLAISKHNAYKRIQQSRAILQKRLKQYLAGLDNSLKKETEKGSVVQEFQFQKPTLSDSVLTMTKGTVELINYQVTATWTEQLLLAQFR